MKLAVIVYQTLLFATQVGKSHYESHQARCFESPFQQICQVSRMIQYAPLFILCKSVSCTVYTCLARLIASCIASMALDHYSIFNYSKKLHTYVWGTVEAFMLHAVLTHYQCYC